MPGLGAVTWELVFGGARVPVWEDEQALEVAVGTRWQGCERAFGTKAIQGHGQEAGKWAAP